MQSKGTMDVPAYLGNNSITRWMALEYVDDFTRLNTIGLPALKALSATLRDDVAQLQVARAELASVAPR